MTMINFPNCLSFVRILMIPILVILYLLPESNNLASHRYEMAALIFALASITDWFDGFLARRWQQETSFGLFIDPVADKLLVVIALMLIISTYVYSSNIYIVLSAIIIVAREIIVASLREWMAKLGKSDTVNVIYLGKLKTTFQMVAITLLLSQVDYIPYIKLLGCVFLVIAAILSLYTMIIYLQKSLCH